MGEEPDHEEDDEENDDAREAGCIAALCAADGNRASGECDATVLGDDIGDAAGRQV